MTKLIEAPAFARMLGLSALLIALVMAAGCTRREADPPRHVIVLTVDTLRADYLGSYGNDRVHTPHIDALIARGARFDSAMTPMPRTTPALASLMTGLSPRRHGSLEVGEAMTAGTPLAVTLEQEGFTTLAVSSSAVAAPAQGLGAGIQRFVTVEEIAKRYEGEIYMHGLPVPPSGISRARAATLEAIRLIEDIEPEERVFLWVHYVDPHVPYRPPSPWNERIEAPRCWDLYERYAVQHPELAWQVFTNHEGVAEPAVEDCQKLYGGEVEAVDTAIGELVAALEERGWLDEALVVFTSDHGEAFGEEGSYFEHGEYAHRSELHVPLAIAAPGLASRQGVAEHVSLEDVVPTVLARLGIEVPPGALDGVDLCGGRRGRCTGRPAGVPVLAESANVMRNPQSTSILSGRPVDLSCIHGERYTLCDHLHGRALEPPRLFDHVADPGLDVDVAERHPEIVARMLEHRRRWPPGSARQRTVLDGRFKLVETPRLVGDYVVELFDLDRDLEEQTDVSEAHPEVVARLREVLRARDEQHPLVVSHASEIDPATRDALRALMYIE